MNGFATRLVLTKRQKAIFSMWARPLNTNVIFLIISFKSVHVAVQLWGCLAYHQMWRQLWACAEPIRFWSLPKCSSIVSFPSRQFSAGRYFICIQIKSCQETVLLNCSYRRVAYQWVATQFDWPWRWREQRCSVKVKVTSGSSAVQLMHALPEELGWSEDSIRLWSSMPPCHVTPMRLILNSVSSIRFFLLKPLNKGS